MIKEGENRAFLPLFSLSHFPSLFKSSALKKAHFNNIFLIKTKIEKNSNYDNTKKHVLKIPNAQHSTTGDQNGSHHKKVKQQKIFNKKKLVSEKSNMNKLYSCQPNPPKARAGTWCRWRGMCGAGRGVE